MDNRYMESVLQQSRDYRDSPFIVIWEVTRACALKCLHCRAEAQYTADPRQLTHEEGKRLIDQIAELDNPLFVLTGGDPLMRPELFELIRYATRERGLSVSMTPSATPRVTREAIARAKDVGLSRWAFSMDGSTAEIHDHFRGVKGSFELTMNGIGHLLADSDQYNGVAIQSERSAGHRRAGQGLGRRAVERVFPGADGPGDGQGHDHAAAA